MKTLLIVDDEKLIADGLCAMLSDAFSRELKVFCTYSAKEALSFAVSSPVDILLTDISMPEGTGLELHAALSRLQPSCQVIYLTGYSDFSYARTALDQHAFAYVLKGEGDDVLTETIRRALKGLGGPEDEASQEGTGDAPPATWLQELHAYITSHLDGDLSLNQLADVCHFHPVYLSRIYKETTGSTLSDFINQARQEKAEDLLRNSHLTVLEISKVMGFATDNYFCRWFRKRTGLSPHAFRAGKHTGKGHN